ncbi:MAG: hypothetical protein PHD25_12805 [Bacteroidales bacterium]|nr:hypothetical protein [Bacteroidales bacterium]
MESRISKFISFAFQPLLMPTLAMLILLQMPVYFAVVIPSAAKWMLLGIIFFTTFFLPASIIFLMARRGMIHSLYIEAREERTVPYVITAIFFMVAFYLLRSLQLSPVYANFMMGAIILVIAVLLINLFWKISSHMAAVGALTGMCMGLSGFLGMLYLNLIIAGLVLSGIVGYARLRLNAHTPAQVYAGFALGLILIGILFMFF